ncbi:hypothetical protein CC80DRAFT_492501 [Byssothecium circinans]|uniref:R3H domain-containing protein n=1 Tax=Byssothecium circinans TaxID=147558 RepID=A0A6A5TUY2_9PLEO|nr:hypothetical protein CC80DRAFT_492501 [Byssothecium circinans]
MPTLLTLPRELRQTILLHAVQQETHLIGRTYPKPILSLLQTCILLRNDMAWVISSWTPTWYLTKPSDLPSPPSITIVGTTYKPTITQITISIFHDTLVKNLKKADWITGYGYLAHPELITAWSASIPSLPKSGIRTIFLDVTPAPGWMRSGHSTSLQSLLKDNRVARLFMNEHGNTIPSLIRQVHDHYTRAVEIKMTGTLNHRSRLFVSRVQMACLQWGRYVEFMGTFLDSEVALIRAVRIVAPKKKPEHVSWKEWESMRLLGVLRRVTWAKDTKLAFERACDEDGEDEMVSVLRQIATFKASEDVERLEMPPAGKLQRAAVHKLSRDLRVSMVSEGEGDERHAVFSHSV